MANALYESVTRNEDKAAALRAKKKEDRKAEEQSSLAKRRARAMARQKQMSDTGPKPTTGRGSIQRKSQEMAKAKPVGDTTGQRAASKIGKFVAERNKRFGENVGKIGKFVAERNKRFGENVGKIASSFGPDAVKADDKPSVPVKSSPNTSTQIPANKGDNTKVAALSAKSAELPKKATATPAKPKISNGEATNSRYPDGSSVKVSASWKPGKAPGDTERKPTNKYYQGTPLPRGAAARSRAMNRNK